MHVHTSFTTIFLLQKKKKYILWHLYTRAPTPQLVIPQYFARHSTNKLFLLPIPVQMYGKKNWNKNNTIWHALFSFFQSFFLFCNLWHKKIEILLIFFPPKLAYTMTYSREMGLSYNREIKRKKCQKIGNIWCWNVSKLFFPNIYLPSFVFQFFQWISL